MELTYCIRTLPQSKFYYMNRVIMIADFLATICMASLLTHMRPIPDEIHCHLTCSWVTYLLFPAVQFFSSCPSSLHLQYIVDLFRLEHSVAKCPNSWYLKHHLGSERLLRSLHIVHPIMTLVSLNSAVLVILMVTICWSILKAQSPVTWTASPSFLAMESPPGIVI